MEAGHIGRGLAGRAIARYRLGAAPLGPDAATAAPRCSMTRMRRRAAAHRPQRRAAAPGLVRALASHASGFAACPRSLSRRGSSSRASARVSTGRGRHSIEQAGGEARTASRTPLPTQRNGRSAVVDLGIGFALRSGRQRRVLIAAAAPQTAPSPTPSPTT